MRQHQTLSSVVNSFLTQNTSPSTSTERDIFQNSLRTLGSQEGSTLAFELVRILESENDPERHGHKGVPEQYIDSLERVAINDIPEIKSAECPICTNRFIDDPYALVVKLPCNVHMKGSRKKAHLFDLECIGPWLKLNSTCPVCRSDLLEVGKKRKQRLEEELRHIRDEEEEEEWDDYG